MKLIHGIADSENQNMRLILEDKSRASLTLRYLERQMGWFFDLKYGDKFVLNGVRLVSSPNVLRQWRWLLPFGLAVWTKGKGEPMRKADLSDGTVELYLLEGDDFALFEEEIFSK
jgi:hypothetical protein